MNLRSGHCKVARMKDGEDVQEDCVAGARVDGIPQAKNFDEIVQSDSATPGRNLGPIKRATKGRVEPEVARHSEFNEGVEMPTDRQPSPDFLPGLRKAVFIIILVIVILVLLQEPLYSGCNKEYQRSDCSDALDKLHQEYPKLKTFWENINITYKMCSKTDRPGVILVLHNGYGNVANCIVNKTASLLSTILGVHPGGEFLTVDGRTALEEYGSNEFLEKIMKQRQRYGVVVFSYLEQIDPKLVKNLHFICDKDPNIRDKAIIILVMKVESQTFINQDLEDMAKRQIKDLWGSTLGNNRVQPIIGRLTNIVESIDENAISKCV